MSCKCTQTKNHQDDELNRSILKAFLVEADQDNSNLHNTVTDAHKHISKFSVFVEEHMITVHQTADEFSQLSLCEMLDKLSGLRNTDGATPYTEYIARISLRKHPDTKQMILPPVHQTLPRLYFERELLATGKEVLSCNTKFDPEQKLAWWREDPGIAEHHYNWHVYYPYTEPPRDRQGELFAYMHEQMLARYDFERLALGLSRVRAYGPGYTWDKALREGYNPRIAGMSFRPANMQISMTERISTQLILTDVMQRNKERLFYAVARGYLECPDSAKIEITMDNLGNTVEANKGSVNRKLYGNIHNDGHNVIATINDPDGRYQVDTGPMISTETAPRDPSFYRWHKFVDAIFEAHRVNLEPYSADDLKMEHITLDSVTTVSDLVKDHSETTNHLYTFMEDKHYTVYDTTSRSIRKSVMNHVPFRYKLKVRNTGTEGNLLVFRIFLAPENEEPLEQWRNMFVELDKFVEYVAAGTELEITRYDKESAVILPPEVTVQDIEQGRSDSATPRCGCGWPRNLLIPRGSPNGMRANLYVLANSWVEDGVNPHEALPGSVSYCGKTGSEYPDKRPMGFPFDRQTTFEDLDNLIKDVSNSTKCFVRITFLESYQEASENVIPDRKQNIADVPAVDGSYVLVD